MKSVAQLLTNLLLAGILVVLVLIWQRMPPTIADFTAAKDNREAQAALAARQPIIRANTTLSEPIRVEVDNSPLSVRVAP